jgi:hypothetical protein
VTDPTRSWTASEANQLRELLGWKLEAFARRLKIHPRTVIRWRDGDTNPTAALWEDLDNLLIDTARKLAPWLAVDQLRKMHRRDILKLLSASATIPLGGMDLLAGTFSQVSNTALNHLEHISTVLAGQYQTSPPDMLLGPVRGHLEKATALLSGAMQPSQRQRLESIVADTALFVGVLSRQSGKLAQARAHLGLAEDMAAQASNMPLLAQAYAQQALLDYYSQTPDGQHDDPRTRVALLAQADELASRFAPAIVHMATSAWLAEDKAAAKDAYGADHALDHSAQALTQAQAQGPVGTGFCSTAGQYHGWNNGHLLGFQGTVEVTLNRPSAVNTIETSLQLKENPRKRATGLADLATALIAYSQPEQACACLIEAHTIGLGAGSASILHHIFSARALMQPTWNQLRCVRELDERLRAG